MNLRMTGSLELDNVQMFLQAKYGISLPLAGKSALIKPSAEFIGVKVVEDNLVIPPTTGITSPKELVMVTTEAESVKVEVFSVDDIAKLYQKALAQWLESKKREGTEQFDRFVEALPDNSETERCLNRLDLALSNVDLDKLQAELQAAVMAVYPEHAQELMKIVASD